MRLGLRYGLTGAALAAALLLAGCTSGGGAAPRRTAGGTASPPTTAAPAAPSPAASDCGPAPESYRPAGPPPAPGHMPTGSTMARIVQRGRLIAGVDQNSYLFGYRDPLTGALDGYEIDVLERISTALFGRPDRIQFRTISSAQRIPVLTTDPHPVDIVIDSMTITCDRWRQVAFSSDYMDAGQRVLVPRTSTAESVRDLAGKKVCAADGTTSIDTLRGLRPAVTPVGVKDWTDCLLLMQLGQVDAVSTDDTILIGLQRQDPNTKLIGPRFTAEPHGIAMQPRQTDFVRFVNAVLEQMRQDGSLKALAQKWLDDGATFGPPPAVYRD
ncbi:glutamate ABC transporter substrate-binding protein [Streptomyces sp. NRRL F-5123]|uniref:glutamate ABC transporter substrate-binding protein n=1 Tax=Streptomyces sp. NRRL F-5123 TaxID=1463856 RepID=UPI0007C4FFF5|nr:glutamate ABC transporter substrate-binding protein [Streptomyces sp. NRRL F-5123]